MTTEERLREIRERAEKATKGPWSGESTPANPQGSVSGVEFKAPDGTTILSSCGCCGGIEALEADAEFVEHAREDVPWLLEEVSKARKALRDIADDNHDGPHEEWYEGGCDSAMMEHARNALK